MDLKQLSLSLGHTEEQADAVIAAMQENGLHVSTNPDTEGAAGTDSYRGQPERHAAGKAVAAAAEGAETHQDHIGGNNRAEQSGCKGCGLRVVQGEQGGKLDADGH